jgi:hypothetical protein
MQMGKRPLRASLAARETTMTANERQPVIDYASPPRPPHPRWTVRERRRAGRIISVLGAHAAALVAYAYAAAVWAKWMTGTSALDSRFTGTNAYIYWIIDVPMQLAALVPFVVAIVVCGKVTFGRWRARFLLMIVASVITWLIAASALLFLSMDIDP